ncbi:MAG: hypothetical protein IJ683_07455 [Butyrivibrio sp.]|nr:hypothetical protein [Butyrivibrio sp.]MBR1642141.1 hypothetical protein [Butyrivibrio sp.]
MANRSMVSYHLTKGKGKRMATTPECGNHTTKGKREENVGYELDHEMTDTGETPY